MERELQGSVFLLQEEVHGEADSASPYDADNGQRKCKGGHRTVNTYAEMKKRHQEEVNALPIYWAFTEERFDEILKELGRRQALQYLWRRLLPRQRCADDYRYAGPKLQGSGGRHPGR